MFNKHEPPETCCYGNCLWVLTTTLSSFRQNNKSKLTPSPFHNNAKLKQIWKYCPKSANTLPIRLCVTSFISVPYHQCPEKNTFWSLGERECNLFGAWAIPSFLFPDWSGFGTGKRGFSDRSFACKSGERNGESDRLRDWRTSVWVSADIFWVL